MIIKVFTVTKDEYDLIEDFIEFYGYIFGYNNLTIIDTGSTNSYVLEYYKKIILEKNVKIVFENGYEGGKQGDFFTKYMTIEKNKNSCDFLLGLDTDNFIILPNTEHIIPEQYINYFENLDKQHNKFCIHGTLDSVVDVESPFYVNNKYLRPAMNCEKFFKSATVHTCFYRTQNFCVTYNGNHQGVTSPDNDPLYTDLTVIHYNDTGSFRNKERCINIIINYKYIKNYIFYDDFESSLINYINICKFVTNNDIRQCGVHRIIQSYSFSLKDFVYELFKKYSNKEFCTIENIIKYVFCDECILEYIDNYDTKNDFWDKIGINFEFSNVNTEKLLYYFGNPIFVNKRSQYTAKNMISDFELFFKNKNTDEKTLLTKEEVYKNFEYVPPYEIINNNILTNFFKISKY